MNRVKDIVRKWLDDGQMTCREAAPILGYHRSFIGEIVTGACIPSRKHVAKWSAFMPGLGEAWEREVVERGGRLAARVGARTVRASVSMSANQLKSLNDFFAKAYMMGVKPDRDVRMAHATVIRAMKRCG